MAKRKMNRPKKNEYFHVKSYYFGTTVGNSFWRRYKLDNFYERGFGELVLTRENLTFRRYLSIEPITIPTRAISSKTYGHGHAAKISAQMVLKVHWQKDGEELVSGFASTKNPKELLQWQRMIFKNIMKSEKN